MRRRAGLTGNQLAERLGWSQAKVSKTETGKTMPTAADIRAFGAAAGISDDELARLIDRFAELTTQVTGWRTLLRSGIAGSQQRVAELERATAVLRQVDPAIVPGLLQTAEYARAMLTGGPDPSADVAAGIAARLARQAVLYEPGRSFQFILFEDALRRQVTDPDTLAVQMDRISQLSTLSNVGVGIVPADRPIPLPPLHGFRIHDDSVVRIELETGAVDIHDPSDIAHYRRMFDELSDAADHDAPARHQLHELARHHRAC